MAAIGTVEDLGRTIRAERRARGWSQARLAQEAGVGRQWLNAVEQGHQRAETGRVLSVCTALDLDLSASSRPAPVDQPGRTWLTAADVARALTGYLADGEPGLALRAIGRFLADLSARAPDELPLALAEPPTTGDRRWDTLLAAATSRACRRRGVSPPAWTDVQPLPEWWFPVVDPVLVARTMQRTPTDLSIKGIWLDAKALEVV